MLSTRALQRSFPKDLIKRQYRICNPDERRQTKHLQRYIFGPQHYTVLSWKIPPLCLVDRLMNKRFPIAQIRFEFIEEEKAIRISQIQGKAGHVPFPKSWVTVMLCCVIEAAKSNPLIRKIEILPARCNRYLMQHGDEVLSADEIQVRRAQFAMLYDRSAQKLGFSMADKVRSQAWGDWVRSYSEEDYEDGLFKNPPCHSLCFER